MYFEPFDVWCMEFNQACWRKVQELGMSRQYAENKTLRKFIRCIVALAFLPCNKIEEVIIICIDFLSNKSSQEAKFTGDRHVNNN